MHLYTFDTNYILLIVAATKGYLNSYCRSASTNLLCFDSSMGSHYLASCCCFPSLSYCTIEESEINKSLTVLLQSE